MVSISILAVLADRDLKKLGAQQRPKEFQSSRSLRTATHVGPALAVRQEISILAVLADRDRIHDAVRDHLFVISILAVLADRDVGTPDGCRTTWISILAVLADRDAPAPDAVVALKKEFQSSRSLRTATFINKPGCDIPFDISILAVLADRDNQHVRRSGAMSWISILAVLADRDPWSWGTSSPSRYFNPRGPCGPRLRLVGYTVRLVDISILAVLADRDPGDPDEVRRPHISILAVLADRDWPFCVMLKYRAYFNPRGPCGPRR